MNTISLIGRLGQDPIRVSSPKNPDKIIAKGSLVVENPHKDYGNDWFNYLALDRQAELLLEYGKRGKWIGMSGRIESRKYRRADGKEVFLWQVVVAQFWFPGTSRHATALLSSDSKSAALTDSVPAMDSP